MFGSIESKTNLINTIKRVNQLDRIESRTVVECINEIGIESYQ